MQHKFAETLCSRVVCCDGLHLYLQELRGAVGQEATGDDRPTVRQGRTKPSDGTCKLAFFEICQGDIVSVLPDLNNVSLRFRTGKILIPVLNFISGLAWQPLNPYHFRFLVPILPDPKQKQVVVKKIKLSSASMMIGGPKRMTGDSTRLVVVSLLATANVSG